MNKTENFFLFLARNLTKITSLVANLVTGVFLSVVGVTSWSQINQNIFKLALFSCFLSFILGIVDWYQSHHQKYYVDPFHKFCIKLFEKHFKCWNGDSALSHNFRVTVYQVRKEKGSEKEYLEYLCRHQSGKKRNPIVRTFNEGEGSAGIVLETGQPSKVVESLPDPQDLEAYKTAHHRLYNVPKEKISLLGRKARDYWSVPVKKFDIEEKVIAVISLDSLLPDSFNTERFKTEVSLRILDEVEAFSASITAYL